MYVSSATTTDGTKVILSFDQPLSTATAPASAFAVMVDSAPYDVTGVATSTADNTNVEQRCQRRSNRRFVTVNYYDPTYDDDIYAIQSQSGDDAESTGSQIVTNNSTFVASSPSGESASVAPVFQSASTSSDGTLVILSYDQTLDSVDTPQSSAFDVQVTGTRIDVSYVSIYGSDVELTLATAIQSGEPVTVSYADPTRGDDTNAIQSLGDGNDAVSLVSQSVTNAVTASTSTAPAFQSATTSTDGTKVILSYDLTLDSVDTAPLSAFDVQVNGTSATINSVSINGSSVELTLATAIKETQTVTLDYNDPTVGDDLYAVQVNSGSDAASLGGISVTNTSTVDGTAPSFISLAWPSSVAQVGGYNGSPWV